MIIILTGVSGSGKTTVGKLLAEKLGWEFFDGDDFHPAANIEKMRRGEPLTDADRQPWLAALQKLLRQLAEERRPAVLACSALKQSYRDILNKGHPQARFVFLKGDYDLIRRRMEKRQGHFFKLGLIKSQFAALEEPADALVADISQKPPAIVRFIIKGLEIK